MEDNLEAVRNDLTALHDAVKRDTATANDNFAAITDALNKLSARVTALENTQVSAELIELELKEREQ